MAKLDRRRKYYCVLDCETATLPCACDYDREAKKKIAIAKPLIYDLGWQIIDNKGNVYKRKSYLITEIFSVPAIFNTAYYASKRPIYLERLANKEITLVNWETAITDLVNDLDEVEAVGAYNSMFDFKKAIPFTELYIKMLYSPEFFQWEQMQKATCNNIASGRDYQSAKQFEPDLFRFRDKAYKLFDLWGLSAKHILNCDEYREKQWFSQSGKYYSTSAEATFRFVTENADFIEAHTAIEDAEIESQIFAIIHKKSKGKWEMGIIYFPFRIVGKVE